MALHAGARSLLDASVGVSDMCLLEPLDEDNFISNLQRRFTHDQIYTYIGSVVVSVNPYTDLPLYTHELIQEYRSRNIYELPPHVYAIADDAYRSMRDRNHDQCVIISGESGSGKTEASKVIMQYVAAVSGKGRDIDRVKEQLLQSNPVLEAFGNAKTLRNDNSSRFGKYMDIEFDFKGDPIGGVISNYLLEKTRVLVQNRGERSFHIFYQLLAGANTSFLKALKLQRNPDHYLFLKLGGAHQCDSIDDKQHYAVTTNAMSVIGFEEEEVVCVFQLVACVLKLGNLQFLHHNNIDGTDGARINQDDEIFEVCDLLRCDTRSLVTALKQRTVDTGGEKVRTDLSASEATYARDALCKAIYARLFTWLVSRINDSIRVKVRGRRKSMGVLDIYGFEIFEVNSFEQFIINYCNEKLQQIFIELTLKEEQEEYIAEGIEWINVEYFNNAIICDLIEKNNVGILAMLDEECLRPGRVSDETFLSKLSQMCANHDHFASRGCRKSQSDKTLPHEAFRLQHYAGAVTYHVAGFIDKNNDLLYRDLSQAMYKCQHPLLKLLFPEGDPERMQRRRPPTAGTQFKASVNALMRNLQSKSPNYIRCIKPNEHKRSRVFEETLVRHQVRYLGLMENVRVRRAGYAFRQPYEAFLSRYKMLALATWPTWRGGTTGEGVEELLASLQVPQEDYALGKTKIFIRNPRTLFAMEECRRDRMHDLATLLQKVWRGWAQRMKFLNMKFAQIIISSQFRGYRERQKYLRLRSATITICAFARGWKARRLAAAIRYRLRCIWAVSVIRKFFYGWQVRKEYRRKFRAIAGPRIVRFFQNCLRRKFLLSLRASLPSVSPADGTWPVCSFMYHDASENLRWLHHKWRCARYRAQCSNEWRSVMREKVIASDIFRDRKANYPYSVPHEFKGEYVRLQNNPKWKRIAMETNDTRLLFADIITKVNRKNGKMVLQLLIVSTNAVLVLDQRTLGIKYRIPVAEIAAMSLSPYFDRVLILHLKKHENGDLMMKKGDFLLSSDHVIEIVAKLFLLIQNATHRSPDVLIANHMNAEMNGSMVEVTFKTGLPEIPPGVIKVNRKSNKLEILQC